MKIRSVITAAVGLATVPLLLLISSPTAKASGFPCGSTKYYVDQVTYAGKLYPLAGDVDGQYPGTITLSKSFSHSNSYTATLGVSKGVVSASVGFNVTETGTTTASYSLATKDTKQGKGTYTVYADHTFWLYDFRIKKVDPDCRGHYGSGTARKWVKYSYGWYKD